MAIKELDAFMGATRRPRPLRRDWLAEIRVIGDRSRVEAPGFALDAKCSEFVAQVEGLKG